MMDTVKDYTIGRANPPDLGSDLARSPQPIQPSYSPQPAPAQTAPELPSPPDPNNYYGDADGYARRLQQYFQQRDEALKAQVLAQVQEMAAPLLRNTAAQSRNMVASDPEFSEVFSKYGHEIDQEFLKNKVPEAARTVEAFKMVAEMIRGRHYKELAQQEARRLQSLHGTGTIRATGSSYSDSPSGDALDKLWDSDNDYIGALKGQRISKNQLREAIAKQGHTVDQWVKLMGSGDIFVAPDGKHVTTRND